MFKQNWCGRVSSIIAVAAYVPCLAAVVAYSLTLISTTAYARFMGVFGDLTSAASQVAGQVGNQLIGGEQVKDIQAERDKFFANLAQQSAGMDAASKQQPASPP